MFKFVHLFKHYFFGLSFIGIAAFVIQEIPYMIMLMLIVRDDVGFFSLSTSREKAFFLLTILMIAINFVGWAFYYAGHQYGWLIVLSQFAVVPLYYLFFGLWKSNYLLVSVAVPFFLIHTINGVLNFTIKK